MFLSGHISCYINGKKLETIIEIRTSNDVNQIGSTCEISVPLNARIENKGQYLVDNVRNLFVKGETVEIKAWYTGYTEITIFKGFVYEFIEGNPTIIRCLDYVYKLRTGFINKSYSDTTLKAVITDIIKGTGINLNCGVDLKINSIPFVNKTPAACLEQIKDETKLVISLNGDSLYVNIVSNTLNSVKLTSNNDNLNELTNGVKEVSLQKKDGAFENYKIQAWSKDAKGNKVKVEIGDADGDIRQIKLTAFKQESHQKIITAAAEHYRQVNYSGKITTFLYPKVELMDEIQYTDVRYSDRSARYTARNIVYELTTKGFEQIITVAYLRSL